MHEIKMGEDGIMRVAIIGDVGIEEAEAFVADMMPFLAQASETQPLNVLWDASRGGKATSTARKTYVTLNDTPGVGKIAIFGANRYSRVLGDFVLKASKRDNIRFFKSSEEALTWLQGKA